MEDAMRKSLSTETFTKQMPIKLESLDLKSKQFPMPSFTELEMPKIGYSYDKQLSEMKAKKKGKEIREAYVDAIPGLKELLEGVHKASERGYVYGLDHRRILVDSRHKSLNYLLQGSAAILAKRWMVISS